MSRLKALLRPRNLLIAAIGLFVLIQLVPVWLLQNNPPVRAEPTWTDPAALAVARRACFDCHSNETIWPLYSRVAPVSWLVTYDVREGREELNFSRWDVLSPRKLANLGEEIAEVFEEGEMPPRIYTLMHPEAVLTEAEQQLLIDQFSR